MEKCTTGAYNVLVVKENTPKGDKKQNHMYREDYNYEIS
jgi:hypothetical protein